MENATNTAPSSASTLKKFIVLVLLTVPALLLGAATFGALMIFGDISTIGTTFTQAEGFRPVILAGGVVLFIAYTALAATFGIVFLALPAGYFFAQSQKLSGALASTLFTAISVSLAILALLIVTGVISPFGLPAFASGGLDKNPEFWTYAIVAGAVCGIVYYMFTRSLKMLRPH